MQVEVIAGDPRPPVSLSSTDRDRTYRSDGWVRPGKDLHLSRTSGQCCLQALLRNIMQCSRAVVWGGVGGAVEACRPSAVTGSVAAVFQ